MACGKHGLYSKNSIHFAQSQHLSGKPHLLECTQVNIEQSKKKSYRKLPRFIEARLNNKDGNEFSAAIVKRIAVTEIQSGLYRHAGLDWQNGQVNIKSPTTIQPTYGRFARRNVEGESIVRRDLPKIKKTITFINPRLWGIPGNICQITQVRHVYRRESYPGRRHAIEARILMTSPESVIVLFRVAKIFSRQDPNLERELLFALNLLQESVGGVNVFPKAATAEQYLSTVHVNWEILPPGERDSNLTLIISAFRPRTPEEREDLERRAAERYDLFETWKPRHIIRGTGGLSGYMGALIKDDMVVFEHLTPGNAIYMLFADWAEQSQRSKTELLTQAEEGKDFLRITHSGDWQLRIKKEVASRV